MPENENAQNASYEELLQRSKKMKKRILIVFLCCVVFIGLLIGVVLLVQALSEKKPLGDFGTYEFSPPYVGDIMQNQEYLDLNRTFCYCEDPDGLGITYPLNEEELAKLDPSVGFVCDYLQTVIDGNVDAYNSMLSAEYIEAHGYQAPFNPQMIYNITIYGYQTQTNADGSRTVTYKLDYMIHQNDGSFRRDMGSDSIRSQFIVLNCAQDGSISIKELVSFRVGAYEGQDL